MIAIAVACNPKLLIADEATTALDVTIQAQVLQLLDNLRAQLKMAVILITHDLGIVAQWADRVVVMYAGRKIEEGLPGPGLRDALSSLYAAASLAASPRAEGRLSLSRRAALPKFRAPSSRPAGEKGCSFRPRCPVARPACAPGGAARSLRISAGRQVACPYVPAIAEVAHVAPVG